MPAILPFFGLCICGLGCRCKQSKENAECERKQLIIALQVSGTGTQKASEVEATYLFRRTQSLKFLGSCICSDDTKRANTNREQRKGQIPDSVLLFLRRVNTDVGTSEGLIITILTFPSHFATLRLPTNQYPNLGPRIPS